MPSLANTFPNYMVSMLICRNIFSAPDRGADPLAAHAGNGASDFPLCRLKQGLQFKKDRTRGAVIAVRAKIRSFILDTTTETLDLTPRNRRTVRERQLTHDDGRSLCPRQLRGQRCTIRSEGAVWGDIHHDHVAREAHPIVIIIVLTIVFLLRDSQVHLLSTLLHRCQFYVRVSYMIVATMCIP